MDSLAGSFRHCVSSCLFGRETRPVTDIYTTLFEDDSASFHDGDFEHLQKM